MFNIFRKWNEWSEPRTSSGDPDQFLEEIRPDVADHTNSLSSCLERPAEQSRAEQSSAIQCNEWVLRSPLDGSDELTTRKELLGGTWRVPRFEMRCGGCRNLDAPRLHIFRNRFSVLFLGEGEDPSSTSPLASRIPEPLVHDAFNFLPYRNDRIRTCTFTAPVLFDMRLK